MNAYVVVKKADLLQATTLSASCRIYGRGVAAKFVPLRFNDRECRASIVE
jgi:hypothetical protein